MTCAVPQVRFDGIPSAPLRSRETMEQAKLQASLRMFAGKGAEERQNAPSAPAPSGPSLNLNTGGAGSSIMSMSILGRYPNCVKYSLTAQDLSAVSTVHQYLTLGILLLCIVKRS